MYMYNINMHLHLWSHSMLFPGPPCAIGLLGENEVCLKNVDTREVSYLCIYTQSCIIHNVYAVHNYEKTTINPILLSKQSANIKYTYVCTHAQKYTSIIDLSI